MSQHAAQDYIISCKMTCCACHCLIRTKRLLTCNFKRCCCTPQLILCSSNKRFNVADWRKEYSEPATSYCHPCMSSSILLPSLQHSPLHPTAIVTCPAPSYYHPYNTASSILLPSLHVQLHPTTILTIQPAPSYCHRYMSTSILLPPLHVQLHLTAILTTKPAPS
jgi:hypothetical protein